MLQSPSNNGKSPTIMHISQKVKLDSSYEPEKFKDAADITGTIVGVGHILTDRQTKPFYVVQLDQGFYSQDERVYVSKLVVDRDNLLPIT